jgi:hypothetical protein
MENSRADVRAASSENSPNSDTLNTSFPRRDPGDDVLHSQTAHVALHQVDNHSDNKSIAGAFAQAA